MEMIYNNFSLFDFLPFGIILVALKNFLKNAVKGY
jgi:hypothetical protein